MDLATRSLFGSSVEQARNGGGIGFPSLEGALLSLAFLTFSVFLIDLIQVSIIKMVNYNYKIYKFRKKIFQLVCVV